LVDELQRLTANAEIAIVLGSIQTSSDIVESGAADGSLLNKVLNKKILVFVSIQNRVILG
jgi:hypothetical protein